MAKIRIVLTQEEKRERRNAAAMAGGNLRSVFEEIMKCEGRCSNCHRIKTWGRRNV